MFLNFLDFALSKVKRLYLIKKVLSYSKKKYVFIARHQKEPCAYSCVLLLNMRSKTRLDLSLGKIQIEPRIANFLTNGLIFGLHILILDQEHSAHVGMQYGDFIF